MGEPEITQGLSEILYCDGVDVVSAVSAPSLSVPVTIAQGGTGATTVGSAQTALQVPPTSRDMIAGTGLTGGGDLSADRTFDVVQALEATLGGAEIATQAETDLGVDDATIVTPLKLANAASQIVSANKAANTTRNSTTVKTADPDLQLALGVGTWLITGIIVWSEMYA